MMKKLISLGLVCVCGSTLIAACSDNTAKNNTKESSTAESSIIQSSTSKQSSDQNNESKQAKDQNKDGKKVNYKVESTYKKGTIGYEADEIEAKREAISEQAPEELSDYDFLTSSGFYAKTPLYLTDSESTEDEKNSEKAEIQANVDQAKLLNEQLKQVKKTVNNSKEYAKLQSEINKALANESYLK